MSVFSEECVTYLNRDFREILSFFILYWYKATRNILKRNFVKTPDLSNSNRQLQLYGNVTPDRTTVWIERK